MAFFLSPAASDLMASTHATTTTTVDTKSTMMMMMMMIYSSVIALAFKVSGFPHRGLSSFSQLPLIAVAVYRACLVASVHTGR